MTHDSPSMLIQLTHTTTKLDDSQWEKINLWERQMTQSHNLSSALLFLAKQSPASAACKAFETGPLDLR